MPILVSPMRPGGVYFGTVGDQHDTIIVSGMPVCASFPPWPTCADILSRSADGLFIGIRYQIALEFAPEVEAAVRNWDRSVVRMGGPPGCAPEEEENNSVTLDFLWSREQPDQCLLAQLGSEVWFYRRGWAGRTQAWAGVVAVGVRDLEPILRGYSLVLPSSFDFPSLAVDIPPEKPREPPREYVL